MTMACHSCHALLRHFWKLGLQLSVVFFARSAAQSAPCSIPCDCKLVPASPPLGYTLRGGRCEGSYEQPIAGADYGTYLVSLTVGEYRFESDGPAIHLDWFRTGMPTHIRVQPRRRAPFYRMDYDAPSSESSFVWATDVLRNIATSSDFLGITARASEGGHDLFVPVRVVQGSSSSSNSIYRAVWVPAYDASAMTMTIHDADGKPISGTTKTMDGVLRASEGVTFTFSQPANRTYVLHLDTQWARGHSGHVSDVRVEL